MDTDNMLGDFLRARRELARPAEYGLPDLARRRVAGLRREEVAMLAGVSVDYYVRLEQGRDKRPSEQVIEALGRVFNLDDEALSHLRALAHPVARRRRPQRTQKVDPALERLLLAWSTTPAMVLGRYLDVLAANPLAIALNACSAVGCNQVRSVFLEPKTRDLYPDWARVAADTVSSLRAAAGADLDDPRLTELVGELTLKSEDFRRLWSRHDVKAKTNGVKRFINPLVGELSLAFETFTVNSTPDQILVVYHAEPASPAERAIALLSSLAAPPRADVSAAHVG